MLGRRAALRLSTLALLPNCLADTASVPIDLSAGPCVVTVLLNGEPARMVLDTGAERTILTRAAVAKYRLKLDQWVGTAMRGVGGKLDEHQNAVATTLSLGGTRLFQRSLGEPISLPVTILELGGLAGLLGADVLRHHLLDLDVPARQLRLRLPQYCGGQPIRLQLLRRSLPLAPIRLDGQSLTALVDTGASVSLINARGLFKFGLDPQRLAADPTTSALGIGGSFTARQHRFGELRIGDRVFTAPTLLAIATPEPAFDVVLGLDLLGRDRLRLSYAESSLWIGG
jgi:hypothetical protein